MRFSSIRGASADISRRRDGVGLRIDADRRLQRRRAIDGEEDRFAERLLRVAPAIERTDDLLRHLSPGTRGTDCPSQPACGSRATFSAAAFTAVIKGFWLLNASYCSRSGCKLRIISAICGVTMRLDPGLHEFLVGREIDLRDALGGREAPLVLGRIAAHGADVVERPRLAAHDPLADGKIGTGGVAALGLERRFIEPGRQHVDQIDIAGELRVLLLGDAAGNEDAEMADGLMNRVDDGLPIGPDLVDVGIADRESSPAPAAAG